MKVIVLSGAPDTGKTTTLRLLAEKFCILILPKVKTEIIVVVKVKNKNVAICSRGDSTRDIKYAIRKISQIRCKIDVFVCPCHPTNKNGFNYLTSISNQLLIVNKTVSTNRSKQLTANVNDSRILFRLI